MAKTYYEDGSVNESKGNKNPLKKLKKNKNFEIKIPTGGSIKGSGKREKEIDDFYKKIRGY